MLPCMKGRDAHYAKIIFVARYYWDTRLYLIDFGNLMLDVAEWITYKMSFLFSCRKDTSIHEMIHCKEYYLEIISICNVKCNLSSHIDYRALFLPCFAGK